MFEYAFPSAKADPYECTSVVNPGITKKEYFAAKAMQGLLANPEHVTMHMEDIAGLAVFAANKLMAALEPTT